MIGIITYHAVHNCGAILQAYAMQNYFKQKGIDCEIINYISDSQVEYDAIYSKRNGIRSIIKNVLLLPYDKKRRKSYDKFETFIQKLDMSPVCKNKYDLHKLNNTIDIFIAGSDQIWNVTKKDHKSDAYFLDFVEDNKTKISYAISIGGASKDDLLQKKDLIMRFDAVSCREEGTTSIISEIAQKQAVTVLDPTLLVENKCFEEIAKEIHIPFENYIFYYSLDGYDKRMKNVEELSVLSKKLGKKIVAFTPEWPKINHNINNVIDIGPAEFLAYIKNADLVCTNSFHGTALSISFRKDFYVLDEYDGKDQRKISILKLLGISDRMISGKNNVEKLNMCSIDYTQVEKRLNELRKQSNDFLQNAIK